MCFLLKQKIIETLTKFFSNIMSKHLRFGKLLGVLAVMLTLSFAWGSAQNTSSEKQLLSFGFTQALNPTLVSNVTGVIDPVNRTVTVTVPFQTVVTGLIPTFTSSAFSNVYYNPVPPGNVLGTPAVSGVTAIDFSALVTFTVEAENHSFEYYYVTVSKAPASTANDMLSFSGGWRKLGSVCLPANSPLIGTNPGTFAGTAVTFPVPYGTVLDEITVHFTLSPFATCDHTTFTIYDFDANNDGVPEALPFIVTSQSGAVKTYSILPVVGVPSEEDYLLAFNVNVTGSTQTINYATQTIAVTVPNSTLNFTPTWVISPYARMYQANPVPAPPAEICSGLVVYPLSPGPDVFHFWIQGEDPSEVSEWVLTVTKAPASTANLLVSIDADYSKSDACQGLYTGHLIGTIGTSTVTFNVPYGVTSLGLHTETHSDLATFAIVPAGGLTEASQITVTSESGAVRTYDVNFVTPVSGSDAKQLLTFGFKEAFNAGWGFTWPVGAVYQGVIDQAQKLVIVTVPYNTDLHHLIAYFTKSEYACVYIAESGIPVPPLTPQFSDVTDNDHSNSLTYVVVAENGTQERYDVTVIKESALTGNDLIGFKLTELPYCFGHSFYEVAGTYTGTNIAVSVKYGTDVAHLHYFFTVSPGATPSPAAAGVADFTSPVTFTVTSQAGVVKTYTVTVTVLPANSAKKLLTYWFDADYNTGLGMDQTGTVNETAKTVTVWIPWEARGLVTGLKASFTLSTGALMTHSEDDQYPQVSGVTANDFTTPVAYTVWAENCSTVEYFVTVNVIPNTNTGISAFTFSTSGCGCGLVNRIDPYARRIYITLPYTTNIASLGPHNITVTPDALVQLSTGNSQYPFVDYHTAVDWTKGPITYKVTAPDGVTTALWTVIVQNPPCQETDILSWSFASGQVGSARIDTTAHTVDVVVANGTNLTNMSYSYSLSCGAVICCNTAACAGTYIDFSDNMCHTCVVTAQDRTITQDWTICLTWQDVTPPVVTTWSVMAYNCTDSVAVQSTELGRVFIVNETALNTGVSPWVSSYNLADWTSSGDVADLVNARLGAWATVTAINTPVYISTHGLYSGTYWAFAVDNSGNVSCISSQKLYLDICDVDVATLCELRDQPLVWRYRLTEEVYVTYEETRSGGNWKFVQDDECGILIEDRLGALPSTAYGVGAGLTNLMGTLYYDCVTLKFIPICCYLPTKSSTGNVVTPVELTYDEFYDECYYAGTNAYESMLVKITTPMIAFDDYHGDLNWLYDNLDVATINAKGDYDWFIQSVFNSPLIGKVIPTTPQYYTGVRTNVDWGWGCGSPFGLITPRKEADIVPVTGVIITADPDPATITGVIPGQCKSQIITIFNEGVSTATITALYLDDTPASDEFHIVAPPAVPFTIVGWGSRDVRVDFCPLNAGDETTNLIVEYGVGKTLVVPINGQTLVIYPTPYYQNFNCLTAPNNEWCYSRIGGNMNTTTAVHGWSSEWTDAACVLVYDGWGTQYEGLSVHMRNRKVIGGVRIPVWVNTPPIHVTGGDPVVSWMQSAILAYHDAANVNDPRQLLVSTDQVNWTVIYATTALTIPSAETGGYQKAIVSLDAYQGQTVWFKFLMLSPSNDYDYWIIDNFAVESRITAPIIAVAPQEGNFGGVQVGASGTLNFAVTNVGISVLKIKKVELVGSVFSLVDTNTYPFEVHDGSWAYTVGSSGASLNFSVLFNPTDIGVQTGKIVITYGLYSDQVLEVPLTGEGLSCYTAATAVIGENHAPGQNTWYKYTADKFSIVTINSCHPHQDAGYDAVYAWDTYLWVYSDCEGTLIGSNDDMEAGCTYNRASSQVQTVMEQGQTIYIFWPLTFPTAEHAYEDFYFNILVSYPIDGDVCQNAIPLTLPVVNHFGTTVGFADDYNYSPCTPYSNYMDGNDKVYTVTIVADDGYLNGNILGAYAGLHVLDLCPTEELTKDHCKASASGPNGGQFSKKIAAGTYFVIVSSWAPPQTVDYLLNLSFRGTGVETNDLANSLNVYPNPTSGKFTVSITNAEAADMILELVNISGQVVYRNEVKAAYSYNEELDASQFAKGVYYLKVNDGKEVRVEKVVVE